MSNASQGSTCEPENRTYVELDLEDFARMFGTVVDDIPRECRDLIARHDFRYRKLEGDEYDQVLLGVLKRIDAGQLTVAGDEGKSRWEQGWAENLKDFMNHKQDLSHLVPKYIRPAQPLRLFQNYVVSPNPNFELDWYEVFRLWLFRKYFHQVETIYEFGCGSGFNLVTLATLYPDKKFYGLDWASASRDIVNELAKTYDWKMQGLLFNFFEPDENVKIANCSAIMTIGALEQSGNNYEPFLQYLLEASPALCVHIEPFVEWYDEDNLIDYAAIKFHKARKYWESFPDRLKALEEEGRVEILKKNRSYFGSLYIEGYSQLIWRPVS